MNFSFSCGKLSFAKAGSIGYVAIGGNQVITFVGKIYRFRFFGYEFTNKEQQK